MGNPVHRAMDNASVSIISSDIIGHGGTSIIAAYKQHWFTISLSHRTRCYILLITS